MRALVCDHLGGIDALCLKDVPCPVPQEGEVLVRVAAAGVNFADTLMIAGKYQLKPNLPFSPGLELAGTVEAVGPGVKTPEVGSRVMAMVPYGAFADFAVVPAAQCFTPPPDMSLSSAAGFLVTYLTAHLGLFDRAGLVPGETVLVTGASGGTGLAAVELAAAHHTTVIGLASGTEKCEAVRKAGATHVIDYRRDDLVACVKDLTRDQGVGVVFDTVGGDLFDAALRVAAWGARLLVIGFAGGRIQHIPANHLLVKHLSAHGLHLQAYLGKAPDKLQIAVDDLCRLYAQRKIRPQPCERFSFDEAKVALSRLSTRQAKGKVVIQIKAD